MPGPASVHQYIYSAKSNQCDGQAGHAKIAFIDPDMIAAGATQHTHTLAHFTSSLPGAPGEWQTRTLAGAFALLVCVRVCSFPIIIVMI